ncbi:MAG: hypothetical protein ABIO39_07995 [Caulobacteraceae bacterium]
MKVAVMVMLGLPGLAVLGRTSALFVDDGPAAQDAKHSNLSIGRVNDFDA